MQAPFNHITIVPEARLLVMGNMRWGAIYVAHLDEDCAAFDAMTEYPVKLPVLSIASSWQASGKGPAIHLFCIQTEVGLPAWRRSCARYHSGLPLSELMGQCMTAAIAA